MSKANIEHLANAWCDEGHKSDDVFKIEVDDKINDLNDIDLNDIDVFDGED
jgi:hypothetical protein